MHPQNQVNALTLNRSLSAARPQGITVQVERETHNDAKEDLQSSLNRNHVHLSI